MSDRRSRPCLLFENEEFLAFPMARLAVGYAGALVDRADLTRYILSVLQLDSPLVDLCIGFYASNL